MAIDTSKYGTSEQWVDTYYQQTALTNKNKKAWFGGSDAQTQFRGGVASGKLSYSVPLDYSLVYCGIGRESALSHCTYLGRDPQNINNCKILDEQDYDVSNCFFSEKTRQYGSSNDPVSAYTYIDSENLNRYAWRANPNLDWNIFPYLEPLTVLNPHNVVLQINVRCSATLTGSCTSMDLNQYIQQHTTYPFIQYVYINPYWGNLADVNDRSYLAGRGSVPRGGMTLTLQRLDKYVIPSENINTQLALQGTQGIIVMGSYGTDRITVFNHAITPFYTTEQGKPHIKISGDYARLEYYDDVIEDILKTVACFGLYFTTDASIVSTMSLTDNKMYIGLIDDDGVGRGRYLQGVNTVNAPQSASDFKDMHSIPYDYETVDKTKYDNSTHFNLNLSLGAFTKFYQLTESQVNDLCSALYDVVNAQPTGTSIEEYNMKCFLTNNPIDCIISLKKFPLNHFPSVGVPNDLYLGTVDTGIDAPLVLSTTWVYYFDFSNSSDTGLFLVNGGSFLDFEPYTTIQINVPFCGSFEVPTTYFHKYGGVRVALMIDFITGACTAYLLVNNDVVDSVSGSCSVDLPVTGLQSATLDGNIHNASMMKEKQQTSLLGGLIAGAVSIGVGLATGSLPLAVGGGAAIIGSFMNAEDTGKQINYNVEHMQLPLKQVGAASGAIAQCNDYRCKMIIKRPALMNYDKEVYAKTIGYACLLNGIVDNFTGLTIGKIEAETIQNGITDEERTMIESLFASGVIL